MLKFADLLQPDFDSNPDICVAERSPLGPRVLRLKCLPLEAGDARVDKAGLIEWLDNQPWVEATAIRPPNVYIRISTAALSNWVAIAFSDRDPSLSSEGRDRPVTVHVESARDATAYALTPARYRVEARAVISLLESRAHPVVSMITADSNIVSDRARHDGCIVTVGGPTEIGSHAFRAVVGDIDVPLGPLRARHGGSLNTEDLLEEFRQRWCANGGKRDHWGSYSSALFCFLMMRTMRRSHIRLDAERLDSDGDAFDSVLAAHRIATALSNSSTDNLVPLDLEYDQNFTRALAVQLDALPQIAARSASELEPALLVRHACSIAECVHSAAAAIPAASPLWRATATALEMIFSLIGIDPMDVHPCLSTSGPKTYWTRLRDMNLLNLTRTHL